MRSGTDVKWDDLAHNQQCSVGLRSGLCAGHSMFINEKKGTQEALIWVFERLWYEFKQVSEREKNIWRAHWLSLGFSQQARLPYCCTPAGYQEKTCIYWRSATPNKFIEHNINKWIWTLIFWSGAPFIYAILYSSNHVNMELTLCTVAEPCWRRNGPF